MKCPNCSTELNNETMFCPTCGTPVAANSQPSYQQTYQPQPAYQQPNQPWSAKQPKNKPIIAITAVVLAVAVLLGMIFGIKACVEANDPQRVSYQTALADIVSMANEHKYIEMIQKYAYGDTSMLLEEAQNRSYILNNLTFTSGIDTEDTQIYIKGDEQFYELISRYDLNANEVTEIVYIRGLSSHRGIVLGTVIDEEGESQLYLACINGKWKAPTEQFSRQVIEENIDY